jgi:hypothetical protein
VIPAQRSELDVWRSNFKGVRYLHPETNFTVFGAIDDLWVRKGQGGEPDEYFVVDYKSTSKLDEVSLDADWQIGYKRQMEVYQWLLRQQGLKVSSQGWFVYCNGIKPQEPNEKAFDGKLDFRISLLSYEGNDDWVEPALINAKACLEVDPNEMLCSDLTECGASCKYCEYRKSAQALEALLSDRGENLKEAELEIGREHLQKRFDDVAAHIDMKNAKAAEKAAIKAEKEAIKATEKAEKAAAKEKEKAEKAIAKEKEKAEKATKKAKERAEKTAAKEKEKMMKKNTPAKQTKK